MKTNIKKIGISVITLLVLLSMLSMLTSIKSLGVSDTKISISVERVVLPIGEDDPFFVYGIPSHNIVISSSYPGDTIFKGNIYNYLGPDTGGPIKDTLDDDGINKYVVMFTETGSYTITVKDIVNNIEDEVDIIVIERVVDLYVPTTVVIGGDLEIIGAVNTGNYVDIAIDDEVVPKLNDLFITADGEFGVKIRTNANYAPDAFKSVGAVEIKAYIDRVASGNIQQNEKEDGSVTILMTPPILTAELSHDEVDLGNDFVVSGEAPGSRNVDILTVAPKGGRGIGLNGDVSFPNTKITGVTYLRTGVSNIDYTFSKVISVNKYADQGTYIVVVLTPGPDGEYNGISSNIILDILDGRYGDISTKSQDKIGYILRDATIEAKNSDDLMWVSKIEVGIPVSTITPTPIPTPSPTTTATEAPTPEEKRVPGFEAIVAIAGLLAVIYLLRMRK